MRKLLSLPLSILVMNLIGNDQPFANRIPTRQTSTQALSPVQPPRTINDRPSDEGMLAIGRAVRQRFEEAGIRVPRAPEAQTTTQSNASRPVHLIITRTFATDESNTSNMR